MCGVTDEQSAAVQIKFIRKYLKLKIVEDNVLFRGHSQERHHVYDLFKRTISHGESHSALMVGPRGSGKTTLINSVLCQIAKEVDLESDAIVIKLNGLIHHDDNIALKSITAQMQLENAVGDRVFGTFAENLAFLLSCLQSGTSRQCRSMLFILEEFDMFCHRGNTQTLLYNLFDITHSKEAPMCVLGVTNRIIDGMELLEKRVKSRFSHRLIYIFPAECDDRPAVDRYRDMLVQMLRIPVVAAKPKGALRKKGRTRRTTVTEEELMETDQEIAFSVPEEVLKRCKVDSQQFSSMDAGFLKDWNAHVAALGEDERVGDAIEKFCYYTVNEQIFRNVLFELVSKLSPARPYIETSDLLALIDKTVAPEHRVKLLQSLSILELSLLIAMKHGVEIFDGQPMNFEMVLHRYTKFANANSSTQTVPRPVILKAFEHLQELEIIMPVRSTGSIYNAGEANRVQKEYTLYTLAVPSEDIDKAVKNFKALPTEINHWYNNSVV